jgi:ABC-type transport system involved in cytochrome c biogenesis permease component
VIGKAATKKMATSRWWIALLVVVIFGYSVGKDLAFRDNAADDMASGEKQ